MSSVIQSLEGARVALVHDWLVGWGGAERVLQELAEMFPSAPIYTSVWAPDAKVARVFGDRDIRTTRLQTIFSADEARARQYRRLLPLMPAAFRALDLGAVDLVISSSHAFSKAVQRPRGAAHLCYCHTPPRYLWDLYHEYSPGWRGWVRAPAAAWLRRQDRQAAAGVDRFVANSETVAERIWRAYGVSAVVVSPPVDLGPFFSARRKPPEATPEDAPFVAGGRMVAYKGLEIAIRAANASAQPLVVFGDGPERRHLEQISGPSVRFLGRVSDEALPGVLASARAFVFPAEEDFGILPVEALAAGTPVLAYARGGAAETVGAVAAQGGGRLIESREIDVWAEAMLEFAAPDMVPADSLQRYSSAAFTQALKNEAQSLLFAR